MPAEAPALTRAELRRRARESAAAESVIAAQPPASRRGPRPAPVVEADDAVEVAVEDLPDLAPEALEIPGIPVDVPLVVETAAAALDAEELRPSTVPIVLPSRRSRVRPGKTADADTSARAEERAIVDEFAAAAKLFSFTGETPVQVAATALAEDAEGAASATAPRRRFGLKRAATASFSVGVLGVVGLLTVGMTTPLEAVAAAKGGEASLSQLAGDVASPVSDSDEDIQAYVAPSGVQNATVDRNDQYQTTTIAEIAAESGISNFSNFFVNDPNAAIQWPFAVGVPITYGFGMRSGNMHEGLDFVPGAGSPVQAIADGTVRIATESGGAYGVTVVIDHVIDGELVSSRYAHMQYGSLQVEAGDTVTVGTFIGRTGNTGRSFGAHTHFEILQNGTTAIDPLPWLREHAGG